MYVMTYVFFALFQIRQMDRTQMMSYIAVIISVKWIQHENLERYNNILCRSTYMIKSHIHYVDTRDCIEMEYIIYMNVGRIVSKHLYTRV